MAVEGLEKLKARLEAIPVEVRKAMLPALEKSAQELQTRMQALAPVETGALRESIEITPPGASTPAHSQPGGSRVANPLEYIVTAGNSAVRYAGAVEFGHKGAAPHPYFWPGFRSLKTRIEGRLKRTMRAAVKAAANGEKAGDGEGAE